MEIIKFLEELNLFLDKSFIFRGYKFLLTFYLAVIFLAISAIIFRVGKLYWTVLVSGQGNLHIKKGSYFNRWAKIEARIDRKSSAEWKTAILEGSQLLNEALNQIGYKKPTLGEKLAQMTDVQLSNLEEVRFANELKNRIVKEENFVLDKKEAIQALNAFENALDFLEAI